VEELWLSIIITQISTFILNKIFRTYRIYKICRACRIIII
jgi:hypothetical protein